MFDFSQVPDSYSVQATSLHCAPDAFLPAPTWPVTPLLRRRDEMAAGQSRIEDAPGGPSGGQPREADLAPDRIGANLERPRRSRRRCNINVFAESMVVGVHFGADSHKFVRPQSDIAPWCLDGEL